MRCRSRLFLVLCLFLLEGLSATVQAQTDDAFFQQFQFNFSFSPPGARPSSMGRTFVALANDATAAITNPAGLAGLLTTPGIRTQIAFEYKHTDLNIQRLADVDSFFTNSTTSFGESVDRPSFFSVAIKLGYRFRLAFTRHESIHLEERFTLKTRAIPELPEPGDTGRFKAFRPSEGIFSLEGVGYGGSFAWAATDRLSLGVTISAESLESRTSETRFDFITSDGVFVNPGNPDDIDIRNPLNRVVLDDKDTALGVVGGVIFQPKMGIHLGATYSSGPRFKLQESFLRNPDPPITPATFENVEGFPTEMTLKIPDRWAFGTAISPTQLLDIYRFDLLLSFDLVPSTESRRFSCAGRGC